MASMRTVFSCVASRDRVPSGPAPGFRSYQYGTLSGIGYAGFVWSATIPTGSGYAHHLYFDYSWLNPQSGSHRSYGLQLRCLQE